MRVLMVGDVVGKSGRQLTLDLIPQIRNEHSVDFVIVNGENAAAGFGITPDIAEALFQVGVDVVTLGNHAWGRREIYPYLDEQPRLLRPANYPPGAPGRGVGIFACAAGRIGVVSLQGRTFMDPIDDPFRAIDTILETTLKNIPVVFIDFHGEATSEKQAFGWHVDGRVSAVVGTHTHVQTADERILPGGTAYLTDVGMTGSIDSVIGMRREGVLSRFITLMPARFEVADGDAQLCGVLIDIDVATGKAMSLRRLQLPPHVIQVTESGSSEP